MSLPPHVTRQDSEMIATIMQETRDVLVSKITVNMDAEEQNRLLIAASCAWLELARTGFVLALGEEGFKKMMLGIVEQLDLGTIPPVPPTSLH